MSTRTHLFSISSLVPIQNAIASRDESLVEAALQAYDREDEDYRAFAESMIMVKKAPRKERGEWCFMIESLAEHFDLSLERLPLEDYKHFYIWPDYREVVEPHLPRGINLLLEFLEEGRPLRGKKIISDGCLFGWLALQEVKDLHQALTSLDEDEVHVDDFDEFHEELVESLQLTAERDAMLLMTAG